jgi:hypothetical protein
MKIKLTANDKMQKGKDGIYLPFSMNFFIMMASCWPGFCVA